ncbi:MAG: hypothetical protein KIS92_12430 [Planctomycetota bacterium]|nr:hypothetical protein [Planctomycetota bacterium]
MTRRWTGLWAVLLLAAFALRAEDGAGEKPGVVSYVKVLSDKVPDVSSLEAWKKSFIKDGMSGQDKAVAIWKSIATFQHQEVPPEEHLGNDTTLGPIKIFNVYGYAMCNSASSDLECLGRFTGMQARGRIISHHSVAELNWDGDWHLLDGSLICYFPKADGKIASVNEIIDDVAAWFEKNPDYRNQNDKLMKYMRGEGWKKGPEILARTIAYDQNGWLPAATHGWYSTMQEYDVKKDQVYEYGCAAGYQVNIQLRKGEKLTRNWFNKGLHVNLKVGGAPGCLNQEIGKDNLRYSPGLGDLAPGRIGNGTLEYTVPLATGEFRRGALAAENLQSKSEGAQAAVQVKDAAKPGVLVVRMPSSYVYVGGKLEFDAVTGKDGAIVVSFSDNNGTSWKELANVGSSGAQSIDLTERVWRRYVYQVRFELKGAGTGLNRLVLNNDLQHSQRPLPALGEGSNTIAFSSGPAEGTMTIEGACDPEMKAKQVTLYDYNPKVEGLKPPGFWVEGSGQVTFPLETPGAIARLRIGVHYRIRDALDQWDVQLSYDGEKFESAHAIKGPTAGESTYFTLDKINPGTKKIWVRFAGTSRNATGMLSLRIDADYKEPFGGFAPVKVTYRWEENGQAKEDVHVAKKAEESWSINCGAKPKMKSIVLERAD